MVVRPRDHDLDLRFLKYAFRGGIDLLPAITGAAQPQITRASLSPIFVRYPKALNEQQRLCAAFDELRKETSRLEAIYARKLLNIAEIKQSLLQKAFSGGFNAARRQATKEAAE
jgi:type I restriction enzyme, S subunit